MPRLREISAHIGRAFAAGIGGSLIGTAISVPALLPTPVMQDQGMPVTPLAGMALFCISLLFTVPSALVLAAPIVWPFRSWIVQRPWLAGLAYGAIGGMAGTAVSLLLDGGRNDSGGMIGATYGVGTGAAFVMMHYLTSSHAPEPPSLDSIFE